VRSLSQRWSLAWCACADVCGRQVFGGDPTRVTIFGESSGGGMVSQLLGAQPAWPYYHRAIMESSSGSFWTYQDLRAAYHNFELTAKVRAARPHAPLHFWPHASPPQLPPCRRAIPTTRPVTPPAPLVTPPALERCSCLHRPRAASRRTSRLKTPRTSRRWYVACSTRLPMWSRAACTCSRPPLASRASAATRARGIPSSTARCSAAGPDLR
jgi:hypothetical protein